MFGNADHSANVLRKGSHAYGIIVHVKRDIVNPLGAKVAVEISVLVVDRKSVPLIPGPADRAVTGKLGP